MLTEDGRVTVQSDTRPTAHFLKYYRNIPETAQWFSMRIFTQLAFLPADSDCWFHIQPGLWFTVRFISMYAQLKPSVSQHSCQSLGESYFFFLEKNTDIVHKPVQMLVLVHLLFCELSGCLSTVHWEFFLYFSVHSLLVTCGTSTNDIHFHKVLCPSLYDCSKL